MMLPAKIIEVILPFHEFQELWRRAAKNFDDLSALAEAPIEFAEELSAAEMTLIALQGGAFDWLQDEPDLYSDTDGEPV
ncbi:MAG: hypothetical protein ONB46_10955 [candidate division KSB1 bacterium]|nr:hypothetical protein [candidate division KSB1 bacterium]